MIEAHFLRFIALCCICLVLQTEANCPYQQCLCAETYMLCRDRSKDVADAPVLRIDLDSIFELDNNMLPANLTEIYFTNGRLTLINDLAFEQSATTLITLSFEGCPLDKIPNALLKLTALQYLSITGMNIQDWNPSAMINIAKTLQTLTLSNVGLSVWPSWLSEFTHIIELAVDNNNMSSIPDGALDRMVTNLTRLTLSNNQFNFVPKALTNLTRLQTLELSQNAISNLTFLPQSNYLTELILNSNSISDSGHVTNSLLQLSGSLSVLDLGSNKLTSIPDLIFMSKIGQLDLSQNRLADVVTGTLPRDVFELDLNSNLLPFIPRAIAALQTLTSLNMPTNLIAEIRGTDFPPTITMVTLDNNQLTHLDSDSFPFNSSIDYLSLNNNPLAIITDTAFTNVPKLTTLNLQNSRLTRVPVALVTISNLGSLDFTGSKSLVCTCGEKALQTWISKRKPEEINGDCGVTSIYVFFTKLSQQCP